ncbi:MAG: alpha/beta hydrolase [Ignavibacteriales bacterium]|nr:alpha/beta hydrolase [Ignavibacteriales bacterium]
MKSLLLFGSVFCFAFALIAQGSSTSMDLPAGCTVHPDLVYKTAGSWKGLLDLYLPGDTTKPVPLVLMFHGGGWNHGKKANVQRGALIYLKYGWAVANIEYRLLDVAPAPAAVEDARCALLWLVKNANRFCLDPQRIVTTGSSAGGHLALMMGLLPPENRFDKDCETGQNYHIVAVINNFGVTDIVEALKKTHWLDGAPDKASLAESLSPLTYIKKGIPPIITVHGDEDPLVPYSQAVRLHQKLDSAGVKNYFYTVHGGKHGKFSKEEGTAFKKQVKHFLEELGMPTGK